MMNKNCVMDDDDFIFFKNRKHTKAVVCGASSTHGLNCEISYMYLDEDPKRDSSYKMEEITSRMEPCMFMSAGGKPMLPGKRFTELRGTVNKWSSFMDSGAFTVEHLSEANLDDVLSMIEEWRYLDNGGKKYMWQERAGCDKAFVRRIVEDYRGIKDEILATVFRINGKCVGYSTIQKRSDSNVDGMPEYKYLTRKCNNVRGTRNLTEFIDYMTFLNLFLENGSQDTDFIINWGASSGGVKWYKEHKWPLYSKEWKWFYREKGMNDGKDKAES